MYKIIGGDQKEYGPITADQIAQWIREGRVAANTQARMEGTEDWKPLSSFPEFAAALGLSPATPPLPGATPPFGYSAPAHDRSAGDALKGPAIALIVVCCIDLLLALFQIVRHNATMQLYSANPLFQDPQMQKLLQTTAGPVGLLTIGFQVLVTLVVLFGAIKMLSLKSYTFAFVAAILAVIPCITPCCGILTLPFGIWALIVLNKPDVKRCFE